jgi:hypothetical protein
MPPRNHNPTIMETPKLPRLPAANGIDPTKCVLSLTNAHGPTRLMVRRPCHGTAVPGLCEESCDTCSNGGLDTADIVFVGTHGGSWSATSATWTMGDVGRRAYSENMRLGDDDDALNIFAAMSCEVMSFSSPDEDALWVRWDSIMKGGLYAAVSSQKTIYFGYYSRNNGKKFVEELQSGAKIRYAWRDGMGAGTYDQDVMALYAGNSSEDCSTRRSGLTWSMPSNFGRRRDSEASNYCYTYWYNE